MPAPYDQELRQQRFLQAHPQWAIEGCLTGTGLSLEPDWTDITN